MDNKVFNQHYDKTSNSTNNPSNNPLHAEDATVAETAPPTWLELIMMIQESALELRNIRKAVELISSETEVRPKNQYLKSEEVMSLMGISERTLYNYRKSKTIIHIKMHGRYLYKRSDVMALLNSGYRKV